MKKGLLRGALLLLLVGVVAYLRHAAPGKAGDTLRISVIGSGAVGLTFGTSFEASGNVALPTTTVAGVRLDMGFFWNTETTKWRIEGWA